MITYNPKKLALVRGVVLSLSESQLPSDLNDLVYRVRDYCANCATAEEWKTNWSSTGLQEIAEVVRDLAGILGLEIK